MLLVRMWNYIRGYVMIMVEGYFLEKFMNICIHRQIFLWDIKRQKNNRMVLKVSIKGFRLLRPVASKSGCRIHIVKKRGLPFVLHRYKKRKAFIIGALVFVAMIYLMSSFIWSVEITGNKKLETSYVLQSLESFGIRPGVLKYRIDPTRAANGMMLNTKELSWIKVSVKGTKVKVELAERKEAPELIASEIPCDVVARRDGVIESIVTRSGAAAVKVGNTVVKDQILIAGTLQNKYNPEESMRVHAMGTVMARTWYEANCLVRGTVQEKQRTGTIKNNYSLSLFSKTISLFHKHYDADGYDHEEINKKLAIGEDLVLPFGIVIDRYYQYEMVEKVLSMEEAKQQAEEKAYNDAVSQMPEGVSIVQVTRNVEENADGDLVANVIIECLENIGETREIGGE